MDEVKKGGTEQKIRVLCVDDSALMRRILTELVGRQPDMEMVGSAPDPLVARELVKRLEPDVLTLDVEMPRMDGLDFLDRLMRLHPMPVVMVSSLTERGSQVTLRALELGAVDFVAKPGGDVRDGLAGFGEMLAGKIRVAARARARQSRTRRTQDMAGKRLVWHAPTTTKIVLIGASTGGTEAIRQVLEPLPEDSPAILITQHMPAGFTASFVKRLDTLCAVSVSEATDGEPVLRGHVYLAPGGIAHLQLARVGAQYVTHLDYSEPVNRHRPSVDALFYSGAKVAGGDVVGIILTGMGRDGARGMLAMRAAGAITLAQDQASCVVFGMPREALLIGAAAEAVPLGQMAGRLLAEAGARA
ncbi:MAG: chemotaxis response regulator protein-glutamate methylesterase [Candidimonas sp.]|nr:MAG: chemotaxis response regulator protein-glutamate methylesterase [Candidimonas sp.]